MSSAMVGDIGIWSLEMRFGDKSEIAKAAAELDELGFGTLWIPGGVDSGVLDAVDELLAVTRRMTIATGILNIWKHNPADVAAWFQGLAEHQQNRVLIGLGVSHGPIIGEAWKKPLAVTREFLDGLQQAGMPRERLCLAALGPKMLALSGERTLGAHPYLTTPEHTAKARQILGAGPLLAPEQGAVFESDADKARAMARDALSTYINLPNYRNNWLRHGLTQEDIDQVSDRLVDALFAWGDIDDIAERVNAHRRAGADHVCVQVIRGARGGDIPGLRAACRQLAERLL